MTFRIRDDETVEQAVRRVASEQINRALAHIDDNALNIHQTVHKVRKRMKKVRGLIRLVRPEFENTYSDENAEFRDAARTLSGIRDQASMIECLDDLLDCYNDEIDRQSFASIRRILVERRVEVSKDKRVSRRMAESADTLKAAKKRVRSWSLDTPEGFEAVSGGLKMTYRRSRSAMQEAMASPGKNTLHEWRKRVKYNRSHIRLMQLIWPHVMPPVLDEVKRLSDLLGAEHDLAVLRDTLLDEPDSFGHAKDVQVLLALIDGRRSALQTRSYTLGRRLYGEKPEHYVKRHQMYWQAWQTERQVNP